MTRPSARLNTVTKRETVKKNSGDEAFSKVEHCYEKETVKKNSGDEALSKVEHCYEKENSKKEQCRR